MNRSGDRDDDRTQLVPRQSDGSDNEKTVLRGRNPGGLNVEDQPLRGKVVGEVANPPLGRRAPGMPGAVQGQGETMLVLPDAETRPDAKPFDPVVGWLTVLKGPGRGESRQVYYGQNSIGRDPKHRVSIDFGDQKISRETHAYIIYDDVQRTFLIRDNGKSNLVRHNGNLVLAATEIKDRDEISIGDTTMIFVSLCNSSFDWRPANEPDKT